MAASSSSICYHANIATSSIHTAMPVASVQLPCQHCCTAISTNGDNLSSVKVTSVVTASLALIADIHICISDTWEQFWIQGILDVISSSEKDSRKASMAVIHSFYHPVHFGEPARSGTMAQSSGMMISVELYTHASSYGAYHREGDQQRDEEAHPP
ncbi:hypothetical protein GOP47_0029888 [Adiantum capillus-veneris]|nr:hypothetical protein GOP47_0029888 [Adiantum capillus-veneris]